MGFLNSRAGDRASRRGSWLWIVASFPAALLAAAPDTGAQLEEVIVTAQRREQSLQETPISVTAFTQEAMQERLITGMADLAHFTPNLEINNGRADGGGSNAAVFIRGVGQFDFIFPTDPGVGVYLDGVYMGRTLGGMMDLADLQRIEVLRGPQGTLYGKNTIAGAVNMVTARPTGELGGTVKLTGGEFGRMDGELTLNLPAIGESLKGKLALVTRKRDGIGKSLWTGRDFDDVDRQAARTVWDWNASEAVDVSFAADVSRWRQHGSMSSVVSFYPSTSGFRELFNAVAAPYLAAQLGLPPGSVLDERFVTGDPTRTWAGGPIRDNGDVWGVAATVDWKLSGSNHLKSVTSWREMRLSFGSDLDNSPFSFAETDEHQDQNQLAQELQLSGLAFGDRLDWLMGVYYFQERGHDRNFVSFGHGILDALEAMPGAFVCLGPGGTDPCAGGAGNPLNFILETDLVPRTSINTHSYSGYAHGIYKFTDRLSLSAGARYTYEDKKWFIVESRPVSGAYVVPPSNLHDTWSAFSPKIGLEYKLTGDAMIYGQVSQGFKSGGWNPRMFDASYLKGYDPEYLTSYEVGFKSEWLDRRLTLNGAAFLYDYRDMQLSSFHSGGGLTNVVLTVENAGREEIKGVELELAARPVEGLDIQIGAGYQTNRYKELAAGVPWSKDNVLPDAPKWTLNAGVQYRIALGGAGHLVPRLDGSYKSKTYKDPQNSPDIVQDGLFLLNAQLGFQSSDERWQVTGFVTNLANKEYITRGLHFSDFGFTVHYPGRPREWGASVAYRF
jgi:iron complex outermembrane receptor protein